MPNEHLHTARAVEKPSRSSGIIDVLPGAMCAERAADQQNTDRGAREMDGPPRRRTTMENVCEPPSRAPNLAGLDRLAVQPCSAHRGHFRRRCQRTPSSRVLLDGRCVGSCRSLNRAPDHQDPIHGVLSLLSCFPSETAEIE